MRGTFTMKTFMLNNKKYLHSLYMHWKYVTLKNFKNTRQILETSSTCVLNRFIIVKLN